jgi:hypothetical protein
VTTDNGRRAVRIKNTALARFWRGPFLLDRIGAVVVADPSKYVASSPIGTNLRVLLVCPKQNE